MGLIEIFSILIIHWFGDFVLQTDKQAKEKSTNFKSLISHTINYTLVWMVIGSALKLSGIIELKPGMLSLFCLGTFLVHTATDYFTSKLNKKLWEKGKTHNFFVSIGFDQILHYIQLFTLYYLIVK